MKYKIFLTIAALIMAVGAGATERVQGASTDAKQMSAMFSYATFATGGQPYVELYLSFNAWTMTFVPTGDGHYRATADILVVMRRSDSIVYAKKYQLHSPTVSHPDSTNFDFLDVQRFSIDNGIYDLELNVSDAAAGNGDAAANSLHQKILVGFAQGKPAMSSVQMMASATPTTKENILSRGGYDMQPYVSDYVPEQVRTMNFYVEFYNIGEEVGNKPFLVYAYIESQETGARAGNMQYIKRKEAAPTVPIYAGIDISGLPSGNYNLVVEARNRDNQTLLARRVPFFRSNPSVKDLSNLALYANTFASLLNDEQQLNMYLDALYPIALEREKTVINDLIKHPGLEEKQAFMYQFWVARDPLNPEGKWREYRERIDYVEKTFSYPRVHGYNTDRGRVYLQYGPPSYVRDEKNFVSTRFMGAGTEGRSQRGDAETATGQIFYLPYQLWRYDLIPGDDPKRVFLFWDEFRSGYYKLLNSNARGEVQDPKWERRLSQQQLNEDLKGEVGLQFDRGY